jgi:hypothetical protein
MLVGSGFLIKAATEAKYKRLQWDVKFENSAFR